MNYVLGMALEEEIWFSSEEEAQECARIFKNLDISAHIRTKVDLESRVMYKAPYSAFKDIIGEEITKLQEAGDEEADELIVEFQDLLENMTDDRDMLAKTFAEHKPGDHVSTKVFDVIVKDGAMPDTEEGMEAFLQEASLTRILELNNLVDIDGEGMVLARTILPEDAAMTVFGDDIPPLRKSPYKNLRSSEAWRQEIPSHISSPSARMLYFWKT